MRIKGLYSVFFAAFAFLAIILSTYLIFAAHVVTTSDGGDSFNVNEDVESLYNISINNTDSGQTANITQVNITLWGNLDFEAGTEGTDAPAVSFSNTSTVLSWTNSTGYLINGSETKYFWFNATATTPGIYNISVLTLNATGVSVTNLSVTVNDTTNPLIQFTNFTETNNTILSRTNIAVNVTASDNSGIDTITLYLYNSTGLYQSNTSTTSPFFVNFTNLPEGEYYFNATVNDSFGNMNSTLTRIVEIDISPPVVYISYPSNGTSYFTNVSELNYTYFETNPGSCWYSINGTNSSIENMGTNFTNVPSRDGANSWTLYCNDSLGNENSTSVTFNRYLSSFVFNGTVYDVDGNPLNNTLINITVKDTSFNSIGSISAYTNASGWFNMVVSGPSNGMYQPVITKANDSMGYVQYIGQSLPAFDSNTLTEIAGTSFYLREAGTINITAINSSGDRISFRYQVKDVKLGYSIAENFNSAVSEAVVYVPKERNYSIMIYPDESMPVSFNWNNFSLNYSYTFGQNLSRFNATTNTLHKQFNTTMGYVRVYGYLNSEGGAAVGDWDEFTVVPYLLEPGDMVHVTYGDLPYNLSSFFDQGSPSDTYNLTSGKYNISLPTTIENSEMILFATARNGSSYYGGVKNTSFVLGAQPNGANIEMNITIYELLGSPANISMESMPSGVVNISTAKQSFSLINSSNASLSGVSAHMEVTVDYSSIGAKEFTWMEGISQQGGSATIRIPLINATGIKEMNVFVGGGNFAPVRKSYTQSQIQSAQNITISSFQPGDVGGEDISSDLKIALFMSNSTCDVPSPSSSCVIGSSDTAGENFSEFNPMKAIMGGGKLSFRMGLFSTGIIVHYVNVDLLASGPPDALFDDSANESTDGEFGAAMRFGSNGPTIYDYVLISMPYTEGNSSTTGLNETADVNISIPLFYDENWNVIWNTSSNGTDASALAGNYSHYSAYQSQWQVLMTGTVCHENADSINATNPCYINKTANRVWVRLPHFSGTGPQISGEVVTATTSTSSSSSSSSSSGGGGGGIGISISGIKKKSHTWTKITPGKVSIMKNFDKEIGIKEIRIEVESEARNAKMIVTKYPEKPASVSKEKTGKVYKYLQIETKNLEGKLAKGTLTIQVNKSWVSGNGLDKDSIAVFKFNESSEQWNELETIYKEEDNSYYYYDVELTSFSYFAISQKPVEEPAETASEAGESAGTTEDKKDIGGAEEMPSEEKSRAWMLVLAIVIVLIIAGWFVISKK